MNLIEFLRSADSNLDRCLYVIYYTSVTEGVSSISTKAIRAKLIQCRISGAAKINVSDCLGKSGYLVDFTVNGQARLWYLTKSGIDEVEKKVAFRKGALPTGSKLLHKICPTEKIHILFLGMGPSDEAPLRLSEETREIEAKLRTSEFRDHFSFKSKWAVRPPDLFQYLNEEKPHILHFSGHGARDGSILFEDRDGRSKSVSPDALGKVFDTMKDNIKVVLLNACFSALAAKEIAKSIDCVVGMSDGIEDVSAIQFSASFYSALGFGHSVLRAFREARATLILEGLPGDHILELFTAPSIRPDEVFLVKT